MSGENSALLWLPVLGGLAVKSLLVFLVAGAALLALRRAVLAAPKDREPTPALRATPPETGGGGVLERGKAGVASGTLVSSALTSSSSRFGRTPVSGANKEVSSVPFPWLPFLLSSWLAGALLSLLRPLLGLWGIGRLSQTSESILDALTLTLAAECASALGLARTPALRSAGAPVPMTWGWRRPVVLLPDGARDWTEGRLRAVLLHEMAHVRRRDWLSHRFADLVCALFWFHPLVWLTARRLRAEGEIACDDLVLMAGVAAPDYARHLLDVARALHPVSAEAVPQAAVAMARTARIERRLRMILDNTRPRRALTRRALLMALGLSAAALVPLAVLRPGARAQAAAPLTASPQHRHREIVHVTPPTPALIWTNNTPVILIGVPIRFVQLAGIASLSTHQWWGADGTALTRPVFDLASASVSADVGDPKQRRVLLALRLPPSGQDLTVKYTLTDSLYSSWRGTWQSKEQSTSNQSEAQFNAQTGGVRVVTATFPASVSKTNVRIGLASGPWIVIGTARRDASGQIAGLSLQRGHTGYIFSTLAETKEGTMLTISVNASVGTSAEDLRIVAVDIQGRKVLPAEIGDSSIGALDQITAQFGLPPSQIKEVRLESRPFHYVEFKNVAVRPAH